MRKLILATAVAPLALLLAADTRPASAAPAAAEAESALTPPRDRFVTSCGAVLRRVHGDLFVLRFDSGEVARYRYVGYRHGGQVFELAQPGPGPYKIHKLVIKGGYLGKVYVGSPDPVFHEGWDGNWDDY